MTTEAPAPPDRILRECDCPPWVVRCVHIEDRILVMTDNSVAVPGCVCANGSLTPDFGVMQAKGPPQMCPNVAACNAWGFHSFNVDFARAGLARVEADAVFGEAESILLGRGDA